MQFTCKITYNANAMSTVAVDHCSENNNNNDKMKPCLCSVQTAIFNPWVNSWGKIHAYGELSALERNKSAYNFGLFHGSTAFKCALQPCSTTTIAPQFGPFRSQKGCF